MNVQHSLHKSMSKTQGQVHKPHPKIKFSMEEDCRLRILVSQCGTEDWNLITNHMPGRNIRQCKERWYNYLSPQVNLNPWTPEEDAKLQQLHNELGSKWVKISSHFPNRSDSNVKNRWLVLSRLEKRLNYAQTQPQTPQQAEQEPIRLEFPEQPVADFDSTVDFWYGNQANVFDDLSFVAF